MLYGRFVPYIPVWERRQQAQRKIAALKRRGRKTNPVVIEGRAIARTFWGKAWCDNLEAYSDFGNRLPRGRTYVRNGSVIDLQIEKGKLAALVSGSRIYTVNVDIRPLQRARWASLVRDCTGKIDSVVELLTGKLSSGVMEVLCRTEAGLFPSAKEISLCCSCPDGARLCKHLAAVLYGVGARFDHEPDLLFVLRGVDKMDLVSEAGTGGAIGKASATATTLDGGSLSGIFGIEMDDRGLSGAGVPANTARGPGKVPVEGRRAGKRGGLQSLVTSQELRARGVRHSAIQSWLRAGFLVRTEERGVYRKSRGTEARIARFLRSS